ncbi:SafA/ExsA family spore coat assembly protein [Halobacillus litoralis]|uniref:SafA/ExsA family spore coat assembly protein n=1 Tax=Halobacillus litoralis TaxID=45668 RepID=UPI0024924280|nr:SafA/ExsA family spore coat assembly protein [Halobacillus litoralis]
MRIHIVQKGDTLWKIAEKYGVDFEELKSVNTQLSNPDMIMPGMKIKVPQGKKQVKKEAPKQTAKTPKKEMPSAPPYKDTSPKPIPSIKEDEKKPVSKGVMEKPMQPMQPMQPINMSMPISMPSIDQQMQNYYTTFHLPQMPMPQQPKEEVKGEASKEEVKGEQYAPMPQQSPMPQQAPMPQQSPMQQAPMPQHQQPYGQPLQPQLINTDFYCCPPHHVMMPMHMPMHQQPMHQPMAQQPMQMWDDDDSGDDMVQGAQSDSDCGCGEGQGPQAYGPMMGYGPPHGFQAPWQQPHHGPMQQPMGWGQPPQQGWGPPNPQMGGNQQPQQGWGPPNSQMGWGQQPQQGWGPPNPQMGPCDPQQMDQGFPQPWRDDDVDES